MMLEPDNEPPPVPSQTVFNGASVLETIMDGCIALDPDWRIVYINAQAERLTRQKRDKVLGRDFWEVFPHAVGSTFERQYRRAMDEQVNVAFEEVSRNLNTWFEVRAYPSPEGLSIFFQNVHQRKEADEALRRSREDLQLAIDAARLGTFYCDWPLDKIIWNETCKQHFFLPPDAEIDFDLFYSLLHPDDHERTRQAIDRAFKEHVEYNIEYRTLAPDGRTRWVNAVGRFYYRPDGAPLRFDGITIDISARKAAEEDLRRRIERERFLAELAERARGLTDPDAVIADAVHSVGRYLGVSRCVFADIDIEADTCTIHPDYRADATVASLEGVVPISAFGAFVVAEYAARRTVVVDDIYADPVKAPPASIAAYEAAGILAHVTVPVVHSGRVVSCISLHNAAPRRWEPEEVALLQAVVERTWLTVEVTRQERALTREAEEAREAHARTAAILESITDAFMAFDAEWRFTYVNDQSERITTRRRDELLGRIFWDEFPAAIGSTFERQYRRAMDERITVSFEEFYPPLGIWVEVRAYPSADGLSVFYQDVTARKRAEEERERMLAEQRARAQREELLNQIGQALRGSADPEAAQATAASLLGEALGADRCYFAVYDLKAGFVTIARDWRRADLPSVQGRHVFVNTVAMFRELYQDSQTSVIADAYAAAFSPQTLANMEQLQIRSRISVALVDDNGLAATLTAAMTDSARDWTPEEVALVEAAATQLRIGMEAVRIQQREHRIATDLQNALQPPLPEQISGLSVGKFTRPALAEAQVGGDFYDIFPLDKGLYALVIGDVSGKGLAAAQQLALIRNSLRTTLYLSRDPAQAAASLNAIVTAHDLLVGFVTAWVGVYDAVTGQVVYCSCGHEPGLIRRADGSVEVSKTTGTPLGVSENAEYTENTITLSSGEALLLYTDGISEAGPSRREMLGTEGLIRLVEALPVGLDAQAEANALMTCVSAFANGIFHDDVAVLLLCRE